MKLFRKLFAEKILRYYEGTEAGIKIIKKLPILKKLVNRNEVTKYCLQSATKIY